jgi:DNA-binding beta-propeller fold protein YncE
MKNLPFTIYHLPFKGCVRQACVLAVAASIAFLSSACRHDEQPIHTEVTPVAPPDTTAVGDTVMVGDSLVVQPGILGFYLLNEGNMGTNKSTLDYFDLTTGEYHRNLYGDANPSVPKELGDVGNDIAIYGSKLYAVINCSNKVEVMDKYTAKRVGQINIPNCRYIAFHQGYAYVSSYAGPVEINPDYTQLGYVAKIDTATLQEVGRCLVGFQPNELEIVNNKIYVANSGGYMAPNYENTVSVIDIETFTEVKRIEVAINLHRLQADRYGTLWVTSNGDHYSISSQLHWIDTHTDTYGGAMGIPASGMALSGDSLYLYSADFSYTTFEYELVYGIVDVAQKQVATRNFLAGGAEQEITMPYGIMVHPRSKDIYITDAANHVYPGALLCFDRHGRKKWQVQTGDIPAHFALLEE